MLSNRTHFALIAAAAAASCVAVACSSDDTATNTSPIDDAGTGSETGTGSESPTDGGTTDGGAIDPAVTTAAAGLITLNPSLPFVAKSIHSASGSISGATWGGHGGPLVTSMLSVTRFTVGGSTDDATSTTITAKTPDGLPASGFFWGNFIDVPSDSVAVQGYTQSATNSPGEVFLFSKNYDDVIARIDANGFFSGITVVDGAKTRLVYSGLSDFSTSEITTSDNGLWAADISATSLEGGASLKLFGWDGFSGPVATDADGNVFVAASIENGAHTDEIYAITKAQAVGAASVTQATVADADTGGTESLAVGGGWVFAKAYESQIASDPSKSVYARAYAVTNGAVASSGDVVTDAIKPVGANKVTVFGSPDGHLWVAVKGATNGYFVELAAKN